MNKLLSIALVIFIGITGVAFGQSGKDAFKALKKIEAKVEMGITYIKYREALGDANVELKSFLESPSAKKSPELARSISKVMGNYKDAADLWATIANHPGRVPYFSPDEKVNPGLRSGWHVNLVETAQKMFKKYPKAYDKVKKHREDSIGPLTGKVIPSQKEISLDDFLAVIWSDASKELKKASEYLKTD